MSRATERLPAALRMATLIATVAAAMIGHQTMVGRAAIERSDALASQGEIFGAIGHAKLAAEAYVPLMPHVTHAYDRLRTIAIRSESQGDFEAARVAWEATRSAIHATHWLLMPFPDRLSEADDHLAALLGRAPTGGVRNDATPAERAAEHRALLARDDEHAEPSVAAVAAMYAGLLTWLLATLRAGTLLANETASSTTYTIDRRQYVRHLIRAAAVSAVGAVVYVSALWVA